MNRSNTELKRKTPMKRGEIKRNPEKKLGFGAVRATGMPRAKRMKSKGPRMTPIRKAARGQECTLRLPGICNYDPATTVLCHSNELADGKGLGLKAPDTEACFGCSACHDVLDGRRPLPAWMTRLHLQGAFEAGKAETHEILRAKGLIKE